MIDKELIKNWRNIVKPAISSQLFKTNYEGMGEQDKEEFERDLDEILDLALIGLKYKTQLSQEGTTKDATFSCGHENDTISRQAAIDALAYYIHIVDKVYNTGKLSADDCRDVAKSVLDDLPPSQPEQKIGHWIAPKYYPTQFTFTCSECGYKQSFNGKFKFCPNCGAKMEGER